MTNENAHYSNKGWARKAMTILLDKMILFEVVDRTAKGRTSLSGVYELGIKFYANGISEWMTIWPSSDSDLDEIRKIVY